MDLKLVPDRDLIAELRTRGIACVIAMIKQDESTGTQEALFGTFRNGSIKTCLGLSALLFERVRREALHQMSVVEVEDVVTEAGQFARSARDEGNLNSTT